MNEVATYGIFETNHVVKNMQSFSENQIRSLYSEFRSHKKYSAKLAFFDRLFGIIPFSFPDFDPRLGIFFQKDKMDKLFANYKRERNNPGLTEKTFTFGETFVFNIKPANSNSPAYNQYILSSFLSGQPRFDEWIRQKIAEGIPVEFLLEEANDILNSIECSLHYDHDKSFHLQCMSIFYKGFCDGFSRHINMPDKKRKFTELYLYAHGIIYSNYTGSLKTAFRNSHYPAEFQTPAPMDLAGKLALLAELGIIDFLLSRNNLSNTSNESKLAEIICQITGEKEERKEEILKILHRPFNSKMAR